MENILKLQISTGAFKFSEIQHRLIKLYAMGSISEEKLNELMAFAAEKASPETERPELLALIQSLFAKVEALSARVKALEDSNADDNTDAEDAGNYPAWEPWDGLSNKYQPGAIVNHGDHLWQSTFSGQNVWEPGTVGDQFWVKYTPEE